MAVINRNLRIDQGADFDVELRLYTDDDATIPFDLTGWSGAMMVRRSYDRPPIASLTANTENGKITINGPLGQIRLHYEPVDTAAPSIRFNGEELECVYDLELTGPAPENRVIRLMEGGVVIDREVTRG